MSVEHENARQKGDAKKQHWCIVSMQVNSNVLVFVNNIHNLSRAVEERLWFVKIKGKLQKPPRPSCDTSEFATLVPKSDKFFSARGYNYVTLWSGDQVVRSYTGSKRLLYAKAQEWTSLNEVTRSEATLRSFGKYEKVVWDSDQKDYDDVVMRLIQPRSPNYCFELAKFIKPLEPLLINQINGMFNPTLKHLKTVLKGMNTHAVAEIVVEKWNHIGEDVVCVMLDAKRFDQHVSEHALRWEHEIYLRYTPPHLRSRLRYLLDMQIENYGRATAIDGSFKYKVKGGRMSGDMNTSLGNTLIMCSLIKDYMAHCCISNFQLVNNGDDSGVMIRLKDLDKFLDELSSWFVKRGITMSMDGIAYDVSEISFCQCSPVLTSNGWNMVRNVYRCLAKDPVSLKSIVSRKEFAGFLYSVGCGGMSLNYGVPVLQSYYNCFVKNALRLGYSETQLDRTKNKFYDPDLQYKLYGKVDSKRRNPEISLNARSSFDRAFGMSPREQRRLEKLFSCKIIDYNRKVTKSEMIGQLLLL